METRSAKLLGLHFRVAITGHRNIDAMGVSAEDISMAIYEALREVEAGVRVCQEGSANYFVPEASFRLLSGLAEGCDRLAAESALALEWQLEAVLPFSQSKYEADFFGIDSCKQFRSVLDKASAVVELDSGSSSPRSEGYRAVGEWLCRNADLLIACWDGEPASGVGGTGWVVERALQEQVPVVWIQPAQGNVQVRLLIPEPTGPVSGKPERWQEDLKLAVVDLIMPPSQDREDQSVAASRLSAYLKEKPKRFSPAVLYPLFQMLFTGRRLRRSDWRMQFSEKSGSQSQFDLVWHLRNADHQANFYAQVYRSAVLINYLFAALAVLMALLGLLFSGFKTLWVSIELALILVMVFNTAYGRRRNWHQRWLDYRQLAERLRVLCELQPLGAASTGDLRWHHRLNRNQPTAWIDWLISTLIRSGGSNNLVLSETYLEGVRCRIAGYLDDQVVYHHVTAIAAHRANHRLHVLGELFLYGTILACLGYLAAYSALETVPDLLKKLVTFVTALLPAFGAAAFGLRAHADFRGIEQRSEVTAEKLSDVGQRIEQLACNYLELLRAADLVRRVHFEEQRDWRVTFEQRPLAVPA